MVRFGFAHWNDAAVRHFAFDMLELNGSVVNPEVVMEDLFHVAQNTLADRRGDVGYRNVTGKRMTFRTDAPDVQVMHVIDAFDPADCGFESVESQAARGSFQQNVHGFAQDAK